MLIMFNDIDSDLIVIDSSDIETIIQGEELEEGVNTYVINTKSKYEITLNYNQMLRLVHMLEENNLLLDCKQY